MEVARIDAPSSRDRARGRTLGITTPEELRQADHKAVIAWEHYMRETEHAAASMIRRRLAALSSLYKHLVRHGHAARNPVGILHACAFEKARVELSSRLIAGRSTSRLRFTARVAQGRPPGCSGDQPADRGWRQSRADRHLR
jgi:hypothetical protein